MEKSNNLLSKNKFLVSVAFIEKIVEKGRRFLDTREGNKRVAHVWKKEKKRERERKEKKKKIDACIDERTMQFLRRPAWRSVYTRERRCIHSVCRKRLININISKMSIRHVSSSYR